MLRSKTEFEHKLRVLAQCQQVLQQVHSSTVSTLVACMILLTAVAVKPLVILATCLVL
jgi:hypothetical protein